MDDQKKQRLETLKRLHEAHGNLNDLLEVFGLQLAEQRGWRELDGMEAVRYYLMQKHNWTPVQLREMSHEDLRFALSAEMQGWTAPSGTP